LTDNKTSMADYTKLLTLFLIFWNQI